jgi:hypothetical protein
VGRTKETIDEKKLSNWKLLDDFRYRLAKTRAKMPSPPAPARENPGGPERLLLDHDYFSLMLFGLFNPVLDSMRGLCAVSHLKRVQEDVCGRQVSLGSFSEGQSVFDPELLRQVFLDMSGEVKTTWGDPRLSQLADKLKLVDGTLMPALSRMHWALWVNEENRAAKLHLKFSVLRQAPCDAIVTAGNSCERKALREFAKKGEIIVGDRYYGSEYGFLNELRGAGISMVFRIRNKPRMKIAHENRGGTSFGRCRPRGGRHLAGNGGARRQMERRAYPGCQSGGGWQGAAAGDGSGDRGGTHRADLPLPLADRTVFFKWMKSILGCRHLLAESPDGVAIQMYTALIAALMLQLLTGKRPGKRAMELIRFYLMGHAELDEVVALLGLEKTAS